MKILKGKVIRDIFNILIHVSKNLYVNLKDKIKFDFKDRKKCKIPYSDIGLNKIY